MAVESTQPKGRWFERTHWSVVLAAGRAAEPERSVALEALCRTYWGPIYAFIRCGGLDRHDAQDATQGFFAHLLERDWLAGLGPEEGKFRSFLLAALKNYLSDIRERAQAVKRGGGQVTVPLLPQIEERQSARDSAALPPERVFDRQWASTVLGQAFAELQKEFLAAGKQAQLLELAVFLGAEGGAAEYDAAATKLGTTRGAIAVAVHRLRQRYRDLVRTQIAQTVGAAADLDDEMRYLLEIAAQ
jgi:DNA-directed RNA polymerase specialized sigma24 family protein